MLACCRILLLSTVLASWGAASLAEAQVRPQDARPESADVVRRRAELQDAITRSGEDAPGLLTPLFRLGYALLDDGRPAEAEQVFRRQLAVAEARFPGETMPVSHALYHLGETYRRSRRCPEALQLHGQALAIREKRAGPDHADIAWSHFRIGLCQLSLARFSDAETALKTALAMHERLAGAESADAATVANDLGDLYLRSGRYAAAVETLQRVLSIREARFGPNDTRLINPLSRLGYGLLDGGQFDEAEKVFRRQLALAETLHPGDTVEVAFPLFHLGETFRRMSRCEDAMPLMQRALAIRERRLGALHESVGRSLEALARCHASLARFDAAEDHFRRAFDIVERAMGPDSGEVATVAMNMAEFYVGVFRFREAEPLLQRSLAIRESVFGPHDFRIPPVLASLARTYRWTERYPQAEAMAKQALAIRERIFGRDHEFTGYSFNELGILYMEMGRYAESEQLNRLALTIFERVFGPEHRQTGIALGTLGETYYAQGRFADARDLFFRAALVLEKAIGPNHPTLVFALRMLGQSERRLGRAEEAIPHLTRALAIAETAYGPENRRVSQVASNLGRAFAAARRDRDAEPLLRRALQINEKLMGPESTAVAYDRLDIARLLMRQSLYPEAETLARQSVENLARIRGAQDFETGWGRVTLAAALENQNQIDKALVELRQATAAFQIQMGRAQNDRGGAGLAEQSTYRSAFMDHAFLLWRLRDGAADRREPFSAEAFEIFQLAQATGTEAAVARMAARFAAGSDKLGELVRSREDAIEQWRAKDALLVQLLGQSRASRNAQQEAALRAELQTLDTHLKELDARIAREFPDYASLATPRPVPMPEIQSLLAPDEALVTWLVGGRRTVILAVRKDRVSFVRVDIGRGALNEAVRQLRAGLDPSNVSSLADIPPFDTTRAHQLYKSIFAPVEPVLAGTRNVFIVPDAGLQSLPLGVLVTEEPAAPIRDFAGYGQVPWLAKRYATTVLPSIGALKSLRRFARTARASQSFIGIGDPTLEGPPGSSRGVNLAKLYARGAVADASEIRKLPPLPETADELRAMAKTLGAADQHLYLGPRATERVVRQLDLRQYRVIAFATHGLMAGEFAEVGEPALVMSPPQQASAEDDGVLTASEIASLQLDADWVILSACNTAAADGTPGAEGLSGLARAFFYAGSRALLVSHWAVLSDATVKLTTTMLGELAANPSVGRADAHRRAMLSMAADADIPHYAHPMFWAPFVVVGEGGAAARQ